MAFLEKIKKLTSRLYPTGRAFKIPFGSVIKELHDGLAESENRALEDGISILSSILPDNDDFTDADAVNWERRLGLISKPTVSLEDRKAAIYRKMNHPGDIPARQHYLYIQWQLQLAGFNLWVYENRFDNGSGGFYEKQPFQFTGDALNPQGGLPYQHGQVQHGYNSGLKVANHLDEVRDSTYLVANLRQTFYVGGSEPGIYGDVPEDRKIELRQLLLLLKPAHSIAYLLIYFGDGIYDTILSSYAGVTSHLGIFVQGNKCYWIDSSGSDHVNVMNLVTGADIPGEAFGAGDIGNASNIWINGNKAYVSDDSGTEAVRVFNILTGAYIPGEDLGVGVVDSPNGVRIIGDKAYVCDTNNEEVHVFEVSTGTHLSTEDFGSGVLNNPEDVEIFDGKGYVLDRGSNTIRVFDLETTEYLEAEDITSVQLNAPLRFRLQNNYFYVVNSGSNEIEVFNRLTRKYDASRSHFALGVRTIHIHDDILFWSDSGFNQLNRLQKN